MIELSHLKIILALQQNGTLTKAANTLCLSQSALSHQIRHLEKKFSISLWEKEGRRLRLTQSGQLLCQTAEQILPIIKQTECTLKAYSEGREGVLRIGVECYPCYKWLVNIIGLFLEQAPNIELDIINKFQFSGLEGLLNHHIDMLITPDIMEQKTIVYKTLANYELMFLIANKHPLAKQSYISPQDIAQETLFTFPVPLERLDIVTQFLAPTHIKLSNIKKIESIDLMLKMTALGRGICALPEWLADSYTHKLNLKKIPIGSSGIHKKLFVALRADETNIPYIKKFISIAKQESINKIA